MSTTTGRKSRKSRNGSRAGAAAPARAASPQPAAPSQDEAAFLRALITAAAASQATAAPASAPVPVTAAQAPPPTSREAPAGLRIAPRPGGMRLLWRAHRPVIAPFGWMAAADATAFGTHYLTHGTGHLWTDTAAVTTAGAWALYRARWAKNSDGSRGRPKRARDRRGRKTPPWALSRSYLAAAWAAGSGWTLTASGWAPAGPHGAVQLAGLAGGLILAAPHLYQRRHQGGVPVRGPATGIPAGHPAAPLAADDPRITAFREKFCLRPGPMRDAELHSFEEVPDGFGFEIKLAGESDGTTASVADARTKIAKLYDVPADQVSVEYGAKRSEARAKVTVLTTENALDRIQVWDGTSTYDPETGMFDLGMFLDSRTAHWQLHKPRSGAAGGVVSGVTGSGKTGTTHVVASEAGQARLCAVCGPDGTCQRCDMRRICALWMGDPQMQPLSVWRGRADLTAWGPEACLRMLRWGHAVMRHRAAMLGQLRWTDHLGRENLGKGWFDPLPDMPLIYIMVDEWPLLAADPELGPEAVKLAGQIAKEGRKTGVCLVFMTQIPDLTELGGRALREMLKAFTVVAHRTDGMSKYMLGIKGDPSELPAGVHGLGFTSGPDQRPDATYRTKYLPEYLQPGDPGAIDVREIADRIAAEPITYERAVLDALEPLGYEGPGQVLGSDGAALPPLTATPLPAPSADAPPRGVPLLAGPASLDAVGRVARALAATGSTGAEIWDLMDATGLSALEAARATSSLVASGHAVQHGDRFTEVKEPAMTPP